MLREGNSEDRGSSGWEELGKFRSFEANRLNKCQTPIYSSFCLPFGAVALTFPLSELFMELKSFLGRNYVECGFVEFSSPNRQTRCDSLRNDFYTARSVERFSVRATDPSHGLMRDVLRMETFCFETESNLKQIMGHSTLVSHSRARCCGCRNRDESRLYRERI